MSRPAGKVALVTGAGRGWTRPRWRRATPWCARNRLHTNLLGAYLCAREAIPFLARSEAGKIITMGSGSRLRTPPRLSAYSAAKAGWLPIRIRWRRRRPSSGGVQPRRRRRTARTSSTASSSASSSPSCSSPSALPAIAARASRVKNSRAACLLVPRAAPICSQVAPAARAEEIRSRQRRSSSISPRANSCSASSGSAGNSWAAMMAMASD